jgi:hypothetical protein
MEYEKSCYQQIFDTIYDKKIVGLELCMIPIQDRSPLVKFHLESGTKEWVELGIQYFANFETGIKTFLPLITLNMHFGKIAPKGIFDRLDNMRDVSEYWIYSTLGNCEELLGSTISNIDVGNTEFTSNAIDILFGGNPEKDINIDYPIVSMVIRVDELKNHGNMYSFGIESFN